MNQNPKPSLQDARLAFEAALDGDVMTEPRAFPAPPKMRAGLYSTDNGRVLCREHLGTTARYTGRDLSGQEIEFMGPGSVVIEAGHPFRCEDCVAIGGAQ